MEFLVRGGHYSLLGMLFIIESNALRAALLMLISILSVIAFTGAWLRLQMIHMTPTSKIESVRYGYVELFGTASQSGEFSLRDPIAHEPCLWFRVETYQIHKDSKGRRHRVQIKSAESSHPFLLRDSSGACLLFPQGAEFTNIMSTSSIPDGKSLEHVVTRIRTGDKLYVLGHIETNKMHGQTTGADSPVEEEDIKQRAREILKGWQQATVVLENFDQNHDGILDASEVRRAQAAALYGAQVAIKREKSKTVVIDKIVRAPTNGRPFLIASHTPDGMRAHFSWRVIMHLLFAPTAFLGAIIFFK